MSHLRFLFLLLLTFSLVGCSSRRGGGGGGDDDDDDGPSGSGSVDADADGVSFGSLDAIYIDEMVLGTRNHAIIATDGMTCARYQSFWQALYPHYVDYQENGDVGPVNDALEDEFRDLPGMPGWFVTLSLTQDEYPVDEALATGAITVTASEFEDGESSIDGQPYPIQNQLGLSDASGSLSAFGDTVAGTISGSAAYMEDWDPTDFETQPEYIDATFAFEASRCDLEDLPDVEM